MSAAFMNGGGIPLPITLAGLTHQPVWVAWHTDFRRRGDPKPTKLPFGPGRKIASANDPQTWGTRQQAAIVESTLDKPFRLGGVGIEFHDVGDGRRVGGIDLDTCRDAATGVIETWAREIIDTFATYTEESPSGKRLPRGVA